MGQNGIIEGVPITLSQRIELALKSPQNFFTSQEIFEAYFDGLDHKIHPEAIVFISLEKILFSTWIFFEVNESSFRPSALYDEKTQKVMIVKGEISDELYASTECQKVDNYYMITTLPVSIFEEIEEEKSILGKVKA